MKYVEESYHGNGILSSRNKTYVVGMRLRWLQLHRLSCSHTFMFMTERPRFSCKHITDFPKYLCNQKAYGSNWVKKEE
jgi:hypothetical protein